MEFSEENYGGHFKQPKWLRQQSFDNNEDGASDDSNENDENDNEASAPDRYFNDDEPVDARHGSDSESAKEEFTWRACSQCPLGRAEWPWGDWNYMHGVIGRMCYSNPEKDGYEKTQEVDTITLAPSRNDRLGPEQELLNCDESVCDRCSSNGNKCAGCAVKIESLPKRVSLGLPGFETREFERPTGATGRRMYVTEDPDGTRSVTKLGLRLKTFSNVYPFGLLAKRCGFEDIIAREWRAPLHGEIPKDAALKFADGGTIDVTDALFARYAEGAPISLVKNLAAFRNTPEENHHDETVKKVAEIYKNLNKTQMLMATVEEFLFSQGDRHPENIHITAEGNLKFIDNVDACFGHYNWAWSEFGFGMNVNTPFIPTTTVFEIERRGFTFPAPNPRIRGTEVYNSLGQMLDYRCHVPGGKIGKKFPRKAAQCIRDLHGMTVEEVRTTFKFQEVHQAALIRAKATLLHTLGFEGALDAMRVASMNKYPLLPPRCTLDDPEPHKTVGNEYEIVDLLPCGVHRDAGHAADDWCIGHEDFRVNVVKNLHDLGLADLSGMGCDNDANMCGKMQ